MSGDVQPRKRKDKKRKKDEPSLEEHRGTAAAFGEGDVQMHSQHDHGTGGHWCAKIIFFSLLAVLVTLIGLIILENRGLTELEANSVESQYSGILDGWTEDTPEDDHHDEHTLELKHHQDHDDIDEPGSENDHEFREDGAEDNDDEHDEEYDHDDVDDDEEEGDDDEEEGDDDEDEGDDDVDDEDEEENVSKEIDDNNESPEDETDEGNENYNGSNEGDVGEIEELNVKYAENRYAKPDDDEDDDDDDNDYDGNQSDEGDLEDDNDGREDTGVDGDDDNNSNELAVNDDDEDTTQSVVNDDENEVNTDEEQDDEDDEEHGEDQEDEPEEEIEKIEKEVTDQDETESAELPLSDESVEKEEETSVEIVRPDEEYVVDDKEFLEVDDLEEPAVERIAPPPPGKPYVEIEDEVSTETPPNTLAEEEEYEKQQEELRQQGEQSTHRQIFAQGQEHLGVWLKLVVGGALLAATHAVLRRATTPRDPPESEQDEHASREETPVTDRRMTLIPETVNIIPQSSLRPKVEEEIVQKVSSVVKAAAVQKQESEEVDEDVAQDEEVEEAQEVEVKKNDEKNKELYSDDDEIEADEDVEDEEEIEEKKETPKPILKASSVNKEPEPEPEDVPDDVEIIDDEQIEEEVEEEVEDEEEISDVDDAELLNRLEAKYGRLPEPDRPGQKHKDGGNSLEDEWPGEPSDPYWREQLEKAEQDLHQGAYGACEERVSAARLMDSGRARWLRARALDHLAEARRDNRVLARAIAAYMRLLEMNERLSDNKLLEVALRTIDRIQFRGTYLNAEPVYRLLIRRFPNDVTYRNNLTISFLMANRADLASEVLKETLRLWPNDRVALAHYGFVLKTEQNKLEESVTYFQRALEGDAGPANEPRFYYHLGDALLMLGRKDEAQEVHKRGAALGHFLSPSQRSLYNVPRLKSQPWWDVEKTPYANLARELEGSWREILKEGEAAQALYEKEKEGLRERGEWSQLDLFVRGREVPGRCERAPVTCRIVTKEPAAQCRRGQVKFSLLSGGSHVRAHVGPTNCRLRMHLALSNTDRTYIRVDQETRQWQVGKVLMFDDSFEHEVWHNGTRPRLVLIVDVWHPALTPRERLALPAI